MAGQPGHTARRRTRENKEQKMSPEKSPEVNQQQQVQKAANSIAAGLRILRTLESRSSASELAEQQKARDEMRARLRPAIEAVEPKLAEAVALAKANREMVNEFMGVVTRKMPLPPHMARERDAFFEKVREVARMLDSIERAEQVVDRARRLLRSERNVTEDTLHEVSMLLKWELVPIADLGHNLVTLLGHLQRYIDALAGKERIVRTEDVERGILPPRRNTPEPELSGPRVVEKVSNPLDRSTNVRVVDIGDEPMIERGNQAGETRAER